MLTPYVPMFKPLDVKPLQQTWRSLPALLLGQRCAACAAPCVGSPVCPACTRAMSLPPLHSQRCPRCATPQPHSDRGAALICLSCIRTPPSFDAVYALGGYESPLRELIAQFKFEQRLVLGAWFAAQLDTLLAGQPFDVITPMALHDNRLRERGYNQAWEIVTRLRHPAAKRHLLTRLRDTPSQRSVSAAQRFANVRGAFAADEPLQGLHVLLLDDVITTTATIDAASKALKTAGAARISVACLARVSD
jgi:ComF family protein